MVRRHRLGNFLPVRCIQRRVCRPSDRVGVACRVLKVPDRAGLRGVEGLEGADVGVVRVGVVDGEIAGVDFVHAVARIEVCQGCDAGTCLMSVAEQEDY